MLRKTLLASLLLIASGSALAFDDFGSRHGVSITPRVTISFGGGGYYDDYRPYGYAPRPVYAEPVYYRSYRGDYGRHHGWNHHRDDWRDNDRYDGDRYEGHHHRD